MSIAHTLAARSLCGAFRRAPQRRVRDHRARHAGSRALRSRRREATANCGWSAGQWDLRWRHAPATGTRRGGDAPRGQAIVEAIPGREMTGRRRTPPRRTCGVSLIAFALAVAVVFCAGVSVGAPTAGSRFGPPRLVAMFPSADLHATVSADASANAIMVAGERGSGQPALFEHRFGAPWRGPLPIPGDGVRQDAAVAAAGSGAAVIVWAQHSGPLRGSSVPAVRDPGQALHGPLPVAAVLPSRATRPSVAIDARGVTSLVLV